MHWHRHGSILILSLSIIICFLFFSLGINKYVTFENFKEYHHDIEGWIDSRFLLTVCVFLLFYILITASSLPIAPVTSMLGGHIFGMYLGTTLVVIGATLGASILFFGAKGSFAPILRYHAIPFLKRIELGFNRNAFNYLLVLRLIPLFPFVAVNIVPALLGISFKIFFWATFIGIIPGACIYVQIGTSFRKFLEQDMVPKMTNILTPSLMLALIGLALISFAPVLYRNFKKIYSISSKDVAKND